jgi:Na+-driven multidrug efflux pump
MAIVALNMASQPIIGFNFGAKSVDRIKQALRITLIAASLISVFFYGILELFPGMIIKVFNNDSPVLYEIAERGLKLVVLVMPIIGFQVVASNFFQAIGKAGLSLFATLFRQVIALIPLLYILPRFWGIDGIWFSFPISDTLSATVVAFLLYREWKRLPLIVGNSSN